MKNTAKQTKSSLQAFTCVNKRTHKLNRALVVFVFHSRLAKENTHLINFFKQTYSVIQTTSPL